MSKKLTPARQKFVSLASKKFGEGEVISKEQIYEIVQENSIGWPSWFSSKSFKTYKGTESVN